MNKPNKNKNIEIINPTIYTCCKCNKKFTVETDHCGIYTTYYLNGKCLDSEELCPKCYGE